MYKLIDTYNFKCVGYSLSEYDYIFRSPIGRIVSISDEVDINDVTAVADAILYRMIAGFGND